MVKDDIISNRTISDEKELNNIFRIENESVISSEIPIENGYSHDNSHDKYIYDKDVINEYEIREIIIGGFIDMETWNKIKEFERDNPDKIRKWREENEEKNEFRYGDNSVIASVNKRNESGKNCETCEEKIIKLCLKKHPKSNFVFSVSEQYKMNGRISDKQMDALKRMIGK